MRLLRWLGVLVVVAVTGYLLLAAVAIAVVVTMRRWAEADS